MRVLSTLVLSFLVSAAPATATGAPEAGPQLRMNLQVLVPVDAAGQAGEPRIADDLPAEAQVAVRERVAALAFAPASRDGEAVPSELSLSVPFTAQNVGGQVQYTVGQPKADPFVKQMPRYPYEALRDGAGAALMVRVELAPQAGADRMRAEVVATEFTSRRASRYQRQFEKAAIDTLSGCCRLVETIDGVPLGGVHHVPVSFSSSQSRERVDTDAFNAAHAGESAGLPEGLSRATIVDSASPDGVASP
ncbi:hypothetical protein [Arenimonas caeni]|uniref:TonB C-terminal domain-containing protein n=1 Tax=Arenimonas caeni TaxID=2058085 RepID=A0A2P6MA66_9GAMM|nr:hypothetical protein [Arenimonas caeni]PRH82887.1 hypothetical protein C6N40_04365 [Arenimonas caeni]